MRAEEAEDEKHEEEEEEEEEEELALAMQRLSIGSKWRLQLFRQTHDHTTQQTNKRSDGRTLFWTEHLTLWLVALGSCAGLAFVESLVFSMVRCTRWSVAT